MQRSGVVPPHRAGPADLRTCERILRHHGVPHPPAAVRRLPLTLLPLLLAAGLGGGLVCTNPDAAAFEQFAGEELVRRLGEELCGENQLPLLLRVMIRDCPQLIRSQRLALARLVGAHTRRRNLALFSLYRTEIGGQQLLPGWSLPRYQATTLALAGRFLVLEAREQDASPER
jgi:hypothetical protein